MLQKALKDFSAESIHAAMFGLIEELGVKNGAVLFPSRVAVSGKKFTPGGIELCGILGKEESCARICRAKGIGFEGCGFAASGRETHSFRHSRPLQVISGGQKK